MATYMIPRANWLKRLLLILALVFLNVSRHGCAPIGWIGSHAADSGVGVLDFAGSGFDSQAAIFAWDVEQQ
jgi:hypothetical protein